ncbi:MAG: SpoIIIAH-like family protein [Oscillospiraceae bacterium]|jgi:stage III sporulation protein AH|nr:SpoIIIAH-like family protein [Oscillospiraceae bacterium]
MFKSKKRHLVLAALILALGTAVYMQWKFAPTEDFVTAGNELSASALGEAYLISNSPSATDGGEENTQPSEETTGGDGSVTASAGESYFAKALAEREKAREEATETLKDIINDASKNGVDKNDAVSRSAVIAQQIKDENAIETLVKAKGFSDCIAIVTETNVSVIIPNTSPLDAAQISIITDIVISQTNVSASGINIVQPKLNTGN